MRTRNREFFLLLLAAVFIPGMASAEDFECLIIVDFGGVNLRVIEDGEVIGEFPVALPRKSPQLPAEGEVVRVEENPIWYPTKATQAYYLKKKKVVLPDVLFPGDPRNAMGEVKLVIKFTSGEIDPVVRIHGTNDPASIGKRISRGCIRMRNEDIKLLAYLMKGRRTRVLFI